MIEASFHVLTREKTAYKHTKIYCYTNYEYPKCLNQT